MDVSIKSNEISPRNTTSNLGSKTIFPVTPNAKENLSIAFNTRSLTLHQNQQGVINPVGILASKALNDINPVNAINKDTKNKRKEIAHHFSENFCTSGLKGLDQNNTPIGNKRRIALLKTYSSFINNNNNKTEGKKSNFGLSPKSISVNPNETQNIEKLTKGAICGKIKLMGLKIKKYSFDYLISNKHHFILIALLILALLSNDIKILCLPPSIDTGFNYYYGILILILIIDSILSCICLPNYALSFQNLIDLICPTSMILEMESIYCKFTFLNIRMNKVKYPYIDYNKFALYIRMIGLVKLMFLMKLFDYYITLKEYYNDQKLVERIREVRLKRKEKRKRIEAKKTFKQVLSNNSNNNFVIKRGDSSAHPKDVLTFPKPIGINNDFLYNANSNSSSSNLVSFKFPKVSDNNRSQVPLISPSIKEEHNNSNMSIQNLQRNTSLVQMQINSLLQKKKEDKHAQSFTAEDYYKSEKNYLEKKEKSINKLLLNKINHKVIIVIFCVCFLSPLTEENYFQNPKDFTYNSITNILDNLISSYQLDDHLSDGFDIVFDYFLNDTASYYYPILNITRLHPNITNGRLTLYENKTINDNRYRLEEIGINLNKREGAVVTFCLKQKANYRSIIAICRTLYLFVIILMLTTSINSVSSTLLLNPIQEMIKIVDIVAQDPVNSKTIDDLKKNVMGSIENIKKKKTNSNYEIKIIQFAIIRISALMAIGFGEAGGEILKENIQSSEGLNPMLEGKKIVAIFGFCYIRNFAEINDVLQEKTMIFVNRISEIVHSAVDKFGGVTNKNLGDCFLLVWKFKDDKVEQFLNNDGLLAALDRSSHLLLNTNNKSYRPMSIEQEERRCFQSDCALLAFLSVIKKINKSRTILEYSNNKALKEKLGNNFKVQMGFGLHMGWAIEGAIGSFYKIDCSYLSPNVNITARLETATNIYGVDILFSGEFYDTLSTYMKQYCRKIDIVALKGCVTPVTLYTVDCNNNLKPGKPKLMNKKINFRDRRIKKQKLRNLYDKQTSKTIGEVYMSRSKGLRHLLKDSKSEAFLNYFDEGYTQYINGDWDEAYKEFKNALFLDNTDGPTRTLMNYIKRFNKVAPEDWDGFRKLESKT